MKEIFSKIAQEKYKSGYSCSESILVAAQETGLISKEINLNEFIKAASAFSAGMGGSGCLCGAVAGSQMVIGLLFGRNSKEQDSSYIKSLSSKFVQKFKEKRKATCCKVLTVKYKDNPSQRRENCANIVQDSAQILFEMAEEELKVFQK